jgi:hypothetical protein
MVTEEDTGHIGTHDYRVPCASHTILAHNGRLKAFIILITDQCSGLNATVVVPIINAVFVKTEISNTAYATITVIAIPSTPV